MNPGPARTRANRSRPESAVGAFAGSPGDDASSAVGPSGSMHLDRRRFAIGVGGLTLGLPGWWLHAQGSAATIAPTALRDAAVSAMRQSDLTPAWFNASNWGNRNYDPWTDYLVGRLSDAEFMSVCARVSDYCLRDVWNLRREKPQPIAWDATPAFNWNGVHALALRFFRTGESGYVRKWLAVVLDYAAWSANDARRADTPVKKGVPAALLDLALTWGGIFTALAIVAKGLPSGAASRPSDRASPFAAVDDAGPPPSADLLPADALVTIARSFASGAAVDLVRFYRRADYVPNQRMFGLEAVAYLAAYFPRADGVAAMRPPLDTALDDALTRYRQVDGGLLEQSFNYAQDLAYAATRLAHLKFEPSPAWGDEARRTSSGWSTLAAALATPGGGLPQVGNAPWGRFGREVPATRFAATSMAFPFSGYYAMRSAWAPDAAYLFFFFRRAARGHSMAGCNSIQLAAFGRQLLAAGGSANYSGKTAAGPGVVAYLSEESSYKTSTVIVDGRSQSGGALQGLARDPQGRPDITRAPDVPIASRWHSSTNFDYVEGLYGEGYKATLDDPKAALVTDVSHWRQVVFVRPLMLWVVVDVLRSSAAHRYTQVWKFAAPGNGLPVPGFAKDQVVLAAGSRTVRTVDPSPGAVNVALHQFGVPALAYQSYFGEPPYGYTGPGPLSEPLPAVDVHAQWEGVGAQVLLTLIVPYRGQQPELKSAVEVSNAGSAGFRIEMQGGARLSVAATATPRRLSAGGVDAADADLLVVLDAPRSERAGLLISRGDSHEFDGSKKTSIVAPTGFSWRTDPSGALVPHYRA